MRGALSMIDWLTALAATTIKTLKNETQYPHGLLLNSYHDCPIIKSSEEHIDMDEPSTLIESFLSIG